MKKSRLLAIAMGALLLGSALQSCSDDDNSPYCIYPVTRPNALVTVKPQGTDKTLLLQLDDSTTLTPLNMAQSPYGEKEVRALCNFRMAEQQGDKRNFKVYINWIDSIRTKTMAPDLEAKNLETYGNDPVEIVRDWTTVAEDGYLTLRFRTRWGDNVPHLVNLVAENKTNPYELTFHHKGNTDGPTADGIVAFKLDHLPDTGGKTVDVTLKWNSFSGAKSVTFKYCTGKSSGTPSAEMLTELPGGKVK